eukprot:2596475-Amphidinium_carterae.1
MTRGKGYKGRGNRKFEHCIDLVAHLCSHHLGDNQHAQLDMIEEQGITIWQMVMYYFNSDILQVPLCHGSVPILPDVIPPHPCGSHNPVLRRPPFFINSITGELGPQAERKGKDGKGKGKDGKDRDGGYGKGKGREEMHKGKGQVEEDANPGKGAYPIGPLGMRAPANPTPPVMKPPPSKASEVTVIDVVKAPQPTRRPAYKPPPASVPWPPAAQRITPIPASSFA